MSRKVSYSELLEIGDNWHSRTHKLREIWQDEKQPLERKLKAFGLFTVMAQRVMKIALKISECQQRTAPKGFVSGGFLLPKR